jgi:hypothetical protein
MNLRERFFTTFIGSLLLILIVGAWAADDQRALAVFLDRPQPIQP